MMSVMTRKLVCSFQLLLLLFSTPTALSFGVITSPPCKSFLKNTLFVTPTPRSPNTSLCAAVEDDGNKLNNNDHDESNERSDVDVVTGVTLKMAFDSSDVWGVADLSEFKSERFTSEGSLDLVHRLRRCSDCVLVGRGTVERDDCTLTVRRVPLLTDRPSQPSRVILDPNQTLLKKERNGEATFKLFHDNLQTLLYHATDDVDDSSLLEGGDFSDGVESIALTDNLRSDDTASFQSYLSPTFVVKDLKKRGIHHVMVEGGPATARTFLEEGVVDRAILIRAPFCFQKPLESLISDKSLTDAGLEKLGTTTCDGDSIEYWSRPNLPWPTKDLFEWP